MYISVYTYLFPLLAELSLFTEGIWLWIPIEHFFYKFIMFWLTKFYSKYLKKNKCLTLSSVLIRFSMMSSTSYNLLTGFGVSLVLIFNVSISVNITLAPPVGDRNMSPFFHAKYNFLNHMSTKKNFQKKPLSDSLLFHPDRLVADVWASIWTIFSRRWIQLLSLTFCASF